jgi:hypothetical protein
MASTCAVFKGPRQIGTASCAAGSASLTSFTLTDAVYNTAIGLISGVGGRNVKVVITEAGTHLARTWNTRIVADNGSGTLTLRDVCPFVGS